MARLAIARGTSREVSKPAIVFVDDVELKSRGLEYVVSDTLPVNRVSNATSSAGSVAGPKCRVGLSNLFPKTYETLKPERLLRLRFA